MNKILGFFIVFLVLFSSLAPCQEFDSANDGVVIISISLDQAMKLMLANSLDIQIAKFDVYRKRTSQGLAESIFDTVLSASAIYRDDQSESPISTSATKVRDNTYSLGVAKKFLTGTEISLSAEDGRSSSNSSVVSTNPYHEAKGTITIKQPIGKNFFGLADRSDLKITQIDIENVEYSSLDAIEKSLYQAQFAYWDLALKEEEVRIRIGMLREAEKLYEIYQDNQTRGLVEKVDMAAIEANLHLRESDVVLASLIKDTAKNDLLFLFNEDDTNIQLQALDNLSLSPNSADFNESLKLAISKRRDYKAMENELKNIGIEIAVNKNSLWPEIDLEASFSRNGINSQYQDSWEEALDSDNDELSLGVSFSFPLENRSARSQLKEAKLKKEQYILKFKRLERLILKDISNLVRKVNSLKINIDLFEKVVSLQEEKLNQEKLRLSRGLSNSDTIIRYEDDLLIAKLSLKQTFFKYRIALLDLEIAQNILLDKYWEGVI